MGKHPLSLLGTSHLRTGAILVWSHDTSSAHLDSLDGWSASYSRRPPALQTGQAPTLPQAILWSPPVPTWDGNLDSNQEQPCRGLAV